MTLTPDEYEHCIRAIDKVPNMKPLLFGEICAILLHYTQGVKK